MKKTNESGRSMVEMLGVLAIIGVLSVGGIAGYTMAMNRYRANEAIDLANKYAMLLYSARQTKLAMGQTWTNPSDIIELEDIGLLEGGQAPSGVKITASAVDDNGATLEIDFGAKGPCKAAVAVLALGSTSCNGNKLSNLQFNASGGTLKTTTSSEESGNSGDE